MSCQYATPLHSGKGNACGLGLYGGRPSNGVCAGCMKRGENTPSIPRQAASLGKAFLGWATSGFSTVPPDILSARLATCRECPEWDADAMGGTGRCRTCRCSTWAKLRMATERCPIGKWNSI